MTAIVNLLVVTSPVWLMLAGLLIVSAVSYYQSRKARKYVE